ncbi:hypothetical protein PWM41_003223 [Providencia rettgeri]|nr:hypothetical protein [Providencia rettgeri]
MENDILVYIDCIERVNFFHRVAVIGKKLNHNYHFITDSITSYLSLKLKQYKVSLLPSLKKNHNIYSYTLNLNNSLDVLNGNQTINYAKDYASSIINLLDKLPKKPRYFFIWNGSNTAGITLSAYAKKNNISCVFFEISNLPKKLFVDPQGVNAKSWIFSNLEFLDAYPEVPEEDFDCWKENWKLYKAGILPQAKILDENRSNYYIDRLFSLLFKKPFINQFKFKKPSVRKKINLDIQPCDLAVNFLFLPLQVSSDSQLKLNSDVDNLMAIDKAYQIASLNDLQLYIKIHPAEFDRLEIHKILEKQRILNFTIVNENTNILIEKSKLLCVINSTVGLEAKILNKKMVVLGNAIYKDFDNERIKKYITHWLINIDYFSNEDIPQSEYMSIFSRIRG